jgi:hypothetical protein
VGGNFRPLIDIGLDYISTKQQRLADGTLARNRPILGTGNVWLDDDYMSVPALAQMGRLTGEGKYFDDAAKQVLQFSKILFVPEKGLYIHGLVEGMQQHPRFYWGRANGWAAMAEVELLSVLPENHPGYAPVLALLREHVRGLQETQGKSGLWHQLLDRPETYEETSASAMFVFAATRAINRGWIDGKAYGPMVSLGWNALAQKVNARGQVEGTCIGTGLAWDAMWYAYRPTSDYAAQGYTPEELITIGEREFAWCESEMKKASRQMGFGDDWHKAVEKVKTMHEDAGQQPYLIRDLARDAVNYLEKHDLITVPIIARETWGMEMMSPQRQLVNPFFTGGPVISVSYPTDTMTHEQKLESMRGNNIPFAHATAFHELIPGHELQGFMSSRYHSERRIFSTPFYVEGWACYWELYMYQRGYHTTPEQRIGALFWRMHRCARIVFSLNFHMGKWTPQQCINYLVDSMGHERDNATAEVRRSFDGSYGPLYQAGYLLGALQLLDLHKELVDSGKMSNRAFHDAVVMANSMPIVMIRAIVTNEKLTPDWKPDWRFCGATPALWKA